MRGWAKHLMVFPNGFNKFSNTGARMQDSINHLTLKSHFISEFCTKTSQFQLRGARWLSGRVSDSGARGRGFKTYRRRVVSLSKTLYSPKVLVNYPGSGVSVPT